MVVGCWGSSARAAAMLNSLRGLQSTCQPCRQAKTKCDMGLPCGRCVRLGIACTPTAPSRRGKKRKAELAAKAAAADPNVKPKDTADHMGDAMIDMAKGARAAGIGAAALADDGAAHPGDAGLVFMAREWVSIALRKRSAKLLSRAFGLCAETGVRLDSVLGGRGGAYLLPLFAPGDHPLLLRPRLGLAELPACLRDRLGSGWGANSTALVRCSRGGRLWYVATPRFEEAFATGEYLEEVYMENKQDAISLLMPEDYSKVSPWARGAGTLPLATRPCVCREHLSSLLNSVQNNDIAPPTPTQRPSPAAIRRWSGKSARWSSPSHGYRCGPRLPIDWHRLQPPPPSNCYPCVACMGPQMAGPLSVEFPSVRVRLRTQRYTSSKLRVSMYIDCHG